MYSMVSTAAVRRTIRSPSSRAPYRPGSTLTGPTTRRCAPAGPRVHRQGGPGWRGGSPAGRTGAREQRRTPLTTPELLPSPIKPEYEKYEYIVLVYASAPLGGANAYMFYSLFFGRFLLFFPSARKYETTVLGNG